MKKIIVIVAMILVVLMAGVLKASGEEPEPRTIFIDGEITRLLAFQVRDELVELEKTSGDIIIYIDSGGGDIIYGFMIIDSMRLCKNDIQTIALGYVGSMAGIILSAGTSGKRYAHQHSVIVLHQMSLGRQEDKRMDVWRAKIKFANQMEKWTYKEIAKNTGKTAMEIRKDLKNDLWLSSEEALKYGLIDYILGE